MSYTSFKEKMYEVNLISAMNSLLSWDMEVNMPAHSDKGFRADQMAFISGLHFQKSTDKELVALVDTLSQSKDLSETEAKNIKIVKKDLEDMLKFTKEFVEKEAKLTSEAHNIWVEARKKSDFKVFEKSLESIVALLREKCEILGYENHPYNALLNQYEEGSNVADLDKLFADVKVRLKPLIEAVKAKQTQTTQFLNQKFDGTKQMELVADILNHLKFDANLYKINLSTHPFCTHFHPTDIRITTRINENDLMSSIWSGIHEMGHGMYEMGLNKDNVGLPISTSTSLGIHESQSRFWENNIGRSRAFISSIFPLMQKHFPLEFAKATVEDLFNEINFVSPSLIRTESDELTYHYHIMIRYEVEKKLIEGSLAVSDVVAYWNQCYKEYLGLDVPNDAQGALQDIHWSMGGLGYFPTYSQGSFYASQWYFAITKNHNIPDLIANQSFEKILAWHTEHIHQYGRLYTSNELCEKATGSKLDFTFFENYIKEKFELN